MDSIYDALTFNSIVGYNVPKPLEVSKYIWTFQFSLLCERFVNVLSRNYNVNDK